VDPPWYFEVYDSVSGSGRTAESYYPCMQTEDICKPMLGAPTIGATYHYWSAGQGAPASQVTTRPIGAWSMPFGVLPWVLRGLKHPSRREGARCSA
jgi:hypothetical protein